jgi:hypothetical protein
MNTTAIIIVAVVLLLGVAAVVFLQRRRSHALRNRFGSEYARAVEDTGSRGKAEAELRERQARVAKLPLTEISPGDRARFSDAWTKLQSEFVDDPRAAVVHADVLLGDVMRARGYPVADFDQRAADISVDHPVVVENYRAAHDIAVRHSAGEASTEDLRQAMIHYRTLFEELARVDEPVVAARPTPVR